MTTVPQPYNVKGNAIRISTLGAGTASIHVWVNGVYFGESGTSGSASVPIVAPVNNYIASLTENINEPDRMMFTVFYMDSLLVDSPPDRIYVSDNTLMDTIPIMTSSPFSYTLTLVSSTLPNINTPLITFPSGVLSCGFTDYYGRALVAYTPGIPHITMPEKQVSLKLLAGQTFQFKKFIGYAISPPTIDIEFNENFILVKAEASGTHLFNVITDEGYINVTIEIESGGSDPAEIIHYVYKGQPYQIPNLTITSTLTIDANNSVVNGLINMNRSMKVTYGSFRYNIIALDAPTPVTLTVLATPSTPSPPTYPYDLYELFSIPTSIDAGDLELSNSLTTFVIPNPRAFEFDTSTHGAGGPMTFKVLQYTVGTLTTISENVSKSDVFAIQGKSFDLNAHISPLSGVASVKMLPTDDTTLYSVSGTSVTILKENNFTGIEVKAIMFNSIVTVTLNMTVVSSDVSEWYFSSAQNVFARSENDSIMLTTELGAEIRITQADASSGYNSDLCEITLNTTHFVILPLRTCMFIGKIGGVGTSVLIHPITAIDTSQRYAQKIPGPSGSVLLKMNLPAGPTYDIKDGATTVGTFTGGEENVPISTVENDLTISITNYNDGSTTIPLRVVEAHSKSIGFIHSRTVSYQYLSPISSPGQSSIGGVTFDSTSINVTKQDAPTQTYDEIIAQDGSNYIVIKFYELPPVPKEQTIYYASGNTFNEVLPSVGYTYTNIGTVTDANTFILTDTIGSVFPTIEFEYGEITNGSIKLVKFDGASALIKIFKSKTIAGTSIKRSVQGTNLAMPFTGSGYTITSGPGGFTFEIDDEYLDRANIPEYFITDTELTLYSFQMLPKLSHPDVYILGANTWVQDVDCTTAFPPAPTDRHLKDDSSDKVTLTNPSMLLYLDVLNMPDYGYTISTPISEIPSFTVYHIDKHLGRVNVVEGYTQSVEFDTYNEFDNITSTMGDVFSINEILSFGTTPDKMESFRTHVAIDTASAVIEAKTNSFEITARAIGKTTVYFLANVTDANSVVYTSRFVALEIVTHQRPYPDTSVIEYYDTTSATENELQPTDPNISITEVNSNGVTTTLAPPVTSLTSPLILKAGRNTIQYTYYNIPVSATFNVKVYKTPGNFDKNHTMRIGESVTLDIINDLFGETAGYEIDSTIPITPVSGILTAVASTNQKQLILTATDGTGTMTTQAFQVQVTISVPNTSVTLPSANAVVDLTVVVWNPLTIKKALIKAPLSATPISQSTPSTMINSGKLLKVENNGVVLYDSSPTANEHSTSYKGFSWATFTPPTVGSSFEIKTLTRMVEQFFFFMESDVFLLVVIALNDPPSKPVFISTGGGNVDLIEEFLPSLRDQLVELGITQGITVSEDLSNIALTAGDNQTSTLRAFGFGLPVDIATFNYDVKLVGPPSVVGNNLIFVTQIGKVLKVKSTEVSFDSVLTCNSLDQTYTYGTGGSNRVTNVSDGIELIFGQTAENTSGTITDNSGSVTPATANATTNMYEVPCKLIRQGITELDVTIYILAYDPANTTGPLSFTTYATKFDLPILSVGIRAYIFEGINYGVRESSRIKIGQTGLPTSIYNKITVTMETEDPRIAFTVQTEDGKFSIYEINYVEPHPTDAKIYLFNGMQEVVGASTITTLSTGSGLPFSADLSTLLLESGQYYAISESGVKVGSVLNNSLANTVTLTAIATGVWANLQFNLTPDPLKPALVLKPYVETLGSPVVQPQDITVEIGKKVSVKLSDYVLNNTTAANGSSNYAFGPSSLTWLPSTAPPSTPPTTLVSGPFSYEGDLLVSSTLNASGTYVITVKVTDRRKKDLLTSLHETTMTITVVVLEDVIDSVSDLLMIGTQKQEIDLGSPVAKIQIGGSSIEIPDIGEITMAGVSFKKGMISNPAAPNFITIQALVTNLQPFSMLIFTKNGKRKIINVTQIKNLKDINLSSFKYIGSVFAAGSSNVVVSFEYNSTVVPPGAFPGLTSPEKIVIASNGVYDIELNSQATITVNYRTSNTTTTSSLTLEVNGQQHKVMSIERLPPPVLELGGTPTKLQVQGTDLAESVTTDLGYAKILYRGDKLYVTDVTALFAPTLIQWELETYTRIIVESTILSLTETTNEQTKYRVPAGTTINFMLDYAPIAVTYDTMILAGADDSFDIYGRVSRTKIGRVTISGQSLQIVADSDVADITQPIGVIKQVSDKKIMNYFAIEIFKSSPTTFTQVPIDHTISTGVLTVVSIGMLDSPYSVVQPTGTLAGKVDALTNAIFIRNIEPTNVFRFYVELSDRSISYYEIGYVEQDIYVSDLTRIPLIAVTTRPASTVVFEDPNVIAMPNGMIHNNTIPTSHVIKMLQPRYVKLLLNQL